MLFKPLEGIMNFVTLFTRTSVCNRFKLTIVSDDEWYTRQAEASRPVHEDFKVPVQGFLTRLGEKDGTEVFRFQKDDSSLYWVLMAETIIPIDGAVVRVSRGMGAGRVVTIACIGHKASVRVDGLVKVYHEGTYIGQPRSDLVSAYRVAEDVDSVPPASNSLMKAFEKAGLGGRK